MPGIPKSAEALALAERVLPGAARVVHVAGSDRDMDAMETGLRFFAPGVEILRFPAWDCLPYDRTSPRPEIMADRMRTLNTLSLREREGQSIILTTANAILQRVPPREAMRDAAIRLERGQAISQDALARALAVQGYRRSGKAMEPGEFALRGSIVDIIPPGMSEGIRLDLFGDDIETIKRFDPMSQRSEGTLESIALTPASEVLLSDESRERFRAGYRELFGAVTREDPLYETLSEGGIYPGMEHWLPLFYPRVETLFDYCSGARIALAGEAAAAIAERFETIRDYYDARREAETLTSKKHSFAAGAPYHPLPPERMFVMEADWQVKIERREVISFTPFTSAATATSYRPALPLPREGNPFDRLKEWLSATTKPLLLACFSEGSRERLSALLSERGFQAEKVEHWGALPLPPKGEGIYLAVLPIENGFETDSILILSEQDVLGERISRARPRKKPSEVFLAEAANFTEGELVVHREHGIGRFSGLVTLTVSGAAHDCLKLVYDGGDKLFLPVENIEMVSRFGLDEEGATLDRLGGASWQARKARLKERITLAAEELLKTAALRQLKPGEVIEAETGAYDEFAARFPYAETDDQERAIADVLEDLHSGKPMDRLICGDVGFGKTEVALRAAFAAVSSPLEGEGIQVALICPTTLLARQHYLGFKARFEGFPVTIRQLSRMVSAREQKAVRQGLADGSVDIVIGTHALLAKNISFKRLGLLIVDEEQHFGVAQKEKLKSLKSDVHVLTLSATPIPRTLQMALTGVRDLSLITTPPVDRLAIRSFVMPFDPVVLREALTREKHRGGKSFIVTPRIKHIGEVKAMIAEIAPELKLAVAHGQMTPGELDRIMNDFYDGTFDALISTAIIESGLDIPSANTIVIHNAHLFGLSQLYQMRGRVGRGKTRAYAYFLLPHHKELTKNATRRLEVMQTLDTLGAGFTLASHDMDIRGFGNLVGEEQSGHIREVGIELYQQMLEEAVAQLKRGSGVQGIGEENTAPRSPESPIPQDWSPAINLGLSVLIPESYVGDLPLRLGLYRRAASMESDAEIESFAAELIDRFGPMPQETRHLIDVLGLKLLCKRAGIERVDVGPKGAVISFRENTFANPEALLGYITKNARSLKARPDQKIVLTREWKNAEDTLAAIKKLAGEIGALAG